MPSRARPALPDDRRQAIAAELRFHQQLEDRARLDKFVRVSFAFDAGMTLREVAAVFSVSLATAHQWKDWGEQERERRRREDPERPGEREQVG